MQPAVVIRLRPLGPWRCGTGSGEGGVDSTFRSDRLYSAVCLAMQRLDLLPEWLEATALSAAPAVVFSSLFPFQADTLFAPPPASSWPPPAALLTSPSPVFLSKIRWTVAQYVPLSVTESLLMAQPLLADQWTIDSESGCLLRRDRPSSSPFRYSSRTSAAVDRPSGVSRLGRSSGCVEFEGNAGLWCVARFADDEALATWGERVRGAFRLLADTGFGGHRSSGWGQAASPEFESGVWPSVLMPKLGGTGTADPEAQAEGEQVSRFWLLSLYSPAQNDSVDWSSGDYRLTSRTGRVESSEGSGAAKKAVRMIAEGSVLSVRAEPVGAAINVAPDDFPHPVYRAGFALACKLPPGEQAAKWKGPVETTPQTTLSDPGEPAAADEQEQSRSCGPAEILDGGTPPEFTGEIEIPAISEESAPLESTEGEPKPIEDRATEEPAIPAELREPEQQGSTEPAEVSGEGASPELAGEIEIPAVSEENPAPPNPESESEPQRAEETATAEPTRDEKQEGDRR